jgi:hypothetical protein
MALKNYSYEREVSHGGNVISQLNINGPVTTIGMATKSQSFGVGFKFGFDRTRSTTTATNVETKARLQDQGDIWGLNASAKLGGLVLYTGAELIVPVDENDQNTVAGNTETDVDESNYDLLFNVNIMPSSGNLIWIAGIYANRYNMGRKTNVTGVAEVEETDLSNCLHGGVKLDLGGVAAKTESARMLVGLNNNLGLKIFDKILNVRSGMVELGFSTTPNIKGEYGFTPRHIAWAGVSHNLDFALARITNEQAGAGNSTQTVDEVTSLTLAHSTTIAELGARYQIENIALEASVASRVFDDGTAALFTGGNLMSHVGLFIKF